MRKFYTIIYILVLSICCKSQYAKGFSQQNLLKDVTSDIKNLKSITCPNGFQFHDFDANKKSLICYERAEWRVGLDHWTCPFGGEHVPNYVFGNPEWCKKSIECPTETEFVTFDPNAKSLICRIKK